MKVLIDSDVRSQEERIDGVEFDIRENEVYITIGHQYVKVSEKDLTKVLKLIE